MSVSFTTPTESMYCTSTSLSKPHETAIQESQCSELGRLDTAGPQDDWLHFQDLAAKNETLLQIPSLEQFLMRHYMERVCHLFCAIDTAKSPWKTIHLPRALQGMAELSVTGRTSKVRNALRNALLSISAWYLTNDHRRHGAIGEADQWAQVASKFGFDAIALLKQAVEFDLYIAPRPKYKEFLATMLSMITVNVRATSYFGLG